MNQSEYGPLTDLVKYAGMLMSAALAIGVAWARRANWESCEEDVPQVPAPCCDSNHLARVLKSGRSGQLNESCDLPRRRNSLFSLALWLRDLNAGIRGKSLAKEKQREVKKTVGGFALTKEARRQPRNAQEHRTLLEGAAYNHDLVWTRSWRTVRS